jgi:hypothetical protein
MVITGLTMMRSSGIRRAQPLNVRRIHALFAPIFFLPVAVSAVTGIVYALGLSWFGMSQKQASLFLRIHQGSYLGPTLKAFYVLLVGLGLIVLLVTGIQMSGILRSRRQ